MEILSTHQADSSKNSDGPDYNTAINSNDGIASINSGKENGGSVTETIRLIPGRIKSKTINVIHSFPSRRFSVKPPLCVVE